MFDFIGSCLTSRQYHWSVVKQIILYLKSTKNIRIFYVDCEMSLIVYSDANFAGDLETRNSTTGYLTSRPETPVTWSFHLQQCVSRSTTEPEYITTSEAAQEVIWIPEILRTWYRHSRSHPPFCRQPNTIRLVENTKYHKRTKNIHVKYHYIRECAEKWFFKFCRICSEAQLADILTKPLQREKLFNTSEDFLYNSTNHHFHSENIILYSFVY